MKKLLLIAVSCLFSTSLLAQSNLNFESKTIRQASDKPKFTINIQYPQIKSPSTEAEKKFNNLSQHFAISEANQFKKTLSGWNTENLPPEMKAHGSSLTVNYDLRTLDPKAIVSVRFSADQYMVGAAHPSRVYSTINYDLANNKALTLQDLFTQNSQYLNKIAAISTHKVTKKLTQSADGHVAIFKEGLTPDLKNYSVWNLTPTDIRFTFNEYQVAAYVYGPQVITIPYAQVSQFLASNTPLTNCVTHNSCQFTVQKPSDK